MNDAAMAVLAVLGTVFDMFTTMFFLRVCLGNDSIRVNRVLFYLLYVLDFGAGMALSQFGAAGIFYVIMTLVLHILLTLMYRSKWTARIFAACSLLVFSMISEVISYGISTSTLRNISDSDMQFYSLMLSKLIMFIIAAAVSLIIRRKNTQVVSGRDYALFIITPVISIITVIVISFELDTGAPNAASGICFAAAGLMVINLVVYYLLENIIEAAELREKQMRTEQQLEYQEEKYEQTARSFNSIRSVIHDTNKHLLYLNQCLEKELYDEAKRYTETAAEHLKSSFCRINTGYLPIDALVSNALSRAEADGIKFTSDINIDKSRINIERYDLCTALGNLLDNAHEACVKCAEGERSISLSIKTTDDSLAIDIVNTAPENVGADLKTDKENKLLHGFGIGNVRAAAEKYGGVLTVTRQGDTFEAALIFPL